MKSELLDSGTAQHTTPVSEELPEFAAVCIVYVSNVAVNADSRSEF